MFIITQQQEQDMIYIFQGRTQKISNLKQVSYGMNCLYSIEIIRSPNIFKINLKLI